MSSINSPGAMSEFIAEALWSEAEESGVDLTTNTFAENGVLTYDEGLVVKVDGVEFYVTVVQR